MYLTLTKCFRSPLDRHLQFVHVLETKGAFLLADGNRVVLVRPDGNVDLIAHLNGGPYQWNGLGAEFEREILQTPVNGFKPLSSAEQALLEKSASYQSARDFPDARHAHDGALLFFSAKNIALLQREASGFTEVARTKTRGRQPVCRALSPESNLLLYGTNYGELYSYTFEKEVFLKSRKIDQLPNTCYQITFSADGRRLFVAGLGFVRVYDVRDDNFTLRASITTAARSFELAEDYLVLNKGIHGLDVIFILDQPERVSSLDLPFAADQMYYLASQRTFLLISGSSDDYALLTWTHYK